MNLPAQVLHHGDGLLVVDKPAGLPVIPGRTPGPCLQQELEASLGKRLWVVHRLDRDTTGVLVFATDAPTHRTLSMAFEEGGVEKAYLALVEGALTHPQRIDLALVPARRGRMRPAHEGEEGKASLTEVRPLEQLKGATLVEARPKTGRTHQIRVHLRSLDHPLLVDPQYGNKVPLEEIGLTRTPLHAASLTLPPLEAFPATTFTAPLPPDMEGALAALRIRSDA